MQAEMNVKPVDAVAPGMAAGIAATNSTFTPIVVQPAPLKAGVVGMADGQHEKAVAGPGPVTLSLAAPGGQKAGAKADNLVVAQTVMAPGIQPYYAMPLAQREALLYQYASQTGAFGGGLHNPVVAQAFVNLLWTTPEIERPLVAQYIANAFVRTPMFAPDAFMKQVADGALVGQQWSSYSFFMMNYYEGMPGFAPEYNWDPNLGIFVAPSYWSNIPRLSYYVDPWDYYRYYDIYLPPVYFEHRPYWQDRYDHDYYYHEYHGSGTTTPRPRHDDYQGSGGVTPRPTHDSRPGEPGGVTPRPTHDTRPGDPGVTPRPTHDTRPGQQPSYPYQTPGTTPRETTPRPTRDTPPGQQPSYPYQTPGTTPRETTPRPSRDVRPSQQPSYPYPSPTPGTTPRETTPRPSRDYRSGGPSPSPTPSAPPSGGGSSGDRTTRPRR